MKIAIITLVTPPRVTGVGHYLQRLLEGLQSVDKDNEYLVLVSKENRHLFPVHAPNFKQVVLPFRHDPRWIMRPLYFFWQNFLFGRFARRFGVDVLHIPNLVPLFRKPIPTVVTLHDFAEHYTTRYDSRFRQWYRKKLPAAIVRCVDAIITISEHSKRDLLSLFKAEERRVHVIYEAAGVSACKIERTDAMLRFLEQHHIASPYALYVGNALPHKNLSVLVRAFGLLKNRAGCDEIRLVFAGGFGAYKQALQALATDLGVQDNIIFTGYVEEEILKQLYMMATCFVFPSKYEGFGLPLLEAMQFDLPVIAARSSCLPEIAGDAAAYADPDDAGEWAEQIERVMLDEELRRQMIVSGQKRCSGFSWELCAQETVDVYRQVFLEKNGRI